MNDYTGKRIVLVQTKPNRWGQRDCTLCARVEQPINSCNSGVYSFRPNPLAVWMHTDDAAAYILEHS